MISPILHQIAENIPPSFVIGGPDNPYLKRWVLHKDPETFSVYLHQILRDDDDRALHDHPWDSKTHVLDGVLIEVHPDRPNTMLCPGDTTTRKATDAHRLEVFGGPVWTLFTTGPKVRDWGFWCPQGWIPWQDFVDPDDPSQPGPGCDQ